LPSASDARDSERDLQRIRARREVGSARWPGPPRCAV